MAPSSGFFTTNNTGDAPSSGYSLAAWQKLFRMLYNSDATLEAVIRGYGTTGDCNCTITGANQVTISGGGAVVNGYWYEESVATTFTVASVSLATRKDLIVLKLDTTAQTIRLAYKSGTEGGAVPTVTQSGGTWEVAIWEVWMAVGGTITLTDKRRYLKDALSGLLSADGTTIQLVGNVLSVKDGGVALAKLAANSVDASKIVDGSVGTAELADGSVANAKLADSAVTTSKLGNNAVTLAKQDFLKHGYVDVVSAGAPSASNTVTFSPAFASTPNIAIAIISSSISTLTAQVSSLTASGCTVLVTHPAGSGWSGTVRVSWIAVL